MNLNELGEDLGINFNKVAAISDKTQHVPHRRLT